MTSSFNRILNTNVVAQRTSWFRLIGYVWSTWLQGLIQGMHRKKSARHPCSQFNCKDAASTHLYNILIYVSCGMWCVSRFYKIVIIILPSRRATVVVIIYYSVTGIVENFIWEDNFRLGYHRLYHGSVVYYFLCRLVVIFLI